MVLLKCLKMVDNGGVELQNIIYIRYVLTV